MGSENLNYIHQDVVVVLFLPTKKLLISLILRELKNKD
jgi:hypothetical protein